MDTLEHVYGYDNTDFANYLRERGFFIASKSTSNYALTFLSLASSLNMEYVNYLRETVGPESQDRAVPYHMIQDSNVVRFLKSKGYKFVHFPSGWSGTDHNPHADLEVERRMGSEFTTVLVQTTLLRVLESKFVGETARGRVLFPFSALPGVVEGIGEPCFAFAHILIPHPPYLFNATGEPVSSGNLKLTGDVWRQKEDYLNQLVFTNTQVRMLVGQILSTADVPPVIVLQADHGPASTFYPAGAGDEWWDNPTDVMLEERMSIFNAYYLPPDKRHLLYDSISPVNTFRVILNTYFDTDYELLNDQNYYSNYTRPYQFMDVTTQVRTRN
jgi:hypothetical protein